MYETDDDLNKITIIAGLPEKTKEYYQMQALWHKALDLKSNGEYGNAIELLKEGIRLCQTDQYSNSNRLNFYNN